jgi:DNA-binding transcriptional LysR family regulator
MDALTRPGLLALRELAEQGTMTAAADVLGVTTGAVSQQLAAMESRLGVALVERVGRRVQLTDAGRLLLRHAGGILQAQDAALAALEASRGDVAGTVVIGVFGSAAALLPDVATAVRGANDAIRIRSRELDVDGAVAAVRRGDVDLAFGLDYEDLPAARDEDIAFDPIRTERFGLAVSASDDRFADQIDLVEAGGSPWILPPAESRYGRLVRNACRRAGFEPDVVYEVMDTAASLALAAAGAGVTPVTPLMRALAPDARLRIVGLRQEVTRSVCLAERIRPASRPSVAFVGATVRAVLARAAGQEQAPGVGAVPVRRKARTSAAVAGDRTIPP